jgi:hypothetical protein
MGWVPFGSRFLILIPGRSVFGVRSHNQNMIKSKIKSKIKIKIKNEITREQFQR